MNKIAKWWTPVGWADGHEPPAYTLASSNDDPAVSYQEAYRRAGYSKPLDYHDGPEEFPTFSLAVWRHEDGHLVVDLFTEDALATEFFVAASNATAFWIDRLPALVASLAAVEQANALDTIQRHLTSFIRHGQGTRTVTHYGATLDEENDRVERQRMQAARNKQ